MYINIIPGPNEPSVDEIDHYVRPVIEQFARAWRPGFKCSCTADSESGAVVEAGILLSINDMPAARKIAGLQGHMSGLICSRCQLRGKNQIYNTDHSLCVPRDVEELRHWSRAYKEAQTLSERKNIFENHGVRWSSLWLLDYWDPTRMLVVDAMHCILEGVVHYHCRHVLRLDASAPKHNADGLMYAFDWPWIGYEPEAVPELPRLKEKHVPDVSKVQETLCLALEGEDSMTLNQVWTRLDNQATKGALQFVVHTLELSLQLNTVCGTISSLFVQRTKQRSKRKQGLDQVSFPSEKAAKTKNHFIALLLNWVIDFSNFYHNRPTHSICRDYNNHSAPRLTYSEPGRQKRFHISRKSFERLRNRHGLMSCRKTMVKRKQGPSKRVNGERLAPYTFQLLSLLDGVTMMVVLPQMMSPNLGSF